jgi:hypothetical protein
MLDTEPQNQVVNAFSVPEFCRRNRIGVTTAYRAQKAGFLRFTKQFGKTLVTAEAEAEFRKLAAEGKLVWPEDMVEEKPGPAERASRKRGRLREDRPAKRRQDAT